METITVILADDHLLLMEGVESVLTQQGIHVLDKIADPWQVVSHYKLHRPAVVILDCRFGEALLGFTVARQLLDADPTAKIVFFSQFDEELILREAYQIGAYAFLSKGGGFTELKDALHSAVRGEKFYPPQVTSRLLHLAIHGVSTPRELLTDREFNVFMLLAQGQSASEIADTIRMTVRTVSTDIHNIKDKLKINKPVQFALMAVKYGYIKP